jgi:glycosyltransferase involved in cell wall biosynthesis
VPDPPHIMHWTYPLPIKLEGAHNIYTIHDLVPLRLPHTTLDDKGYYLALIRGCIAHASRICTVSDSSRADILRLFPQAAGKVTNTYESIDISTESVPEGAELDDFLHGVFGLKTRGYFLFFGSLEPKKNIGRLLEAYLSAGITAPLVIVGAQAWKSERELGLLKLHNHRLEGGPQIRQIDYLPFATLLRLISGARAVVFPSMKGSACRWWRQWRSARQRSPRRRALCWKLPATARLWSIPTIHGRFQPGCGGWIPTMDCAHVCRAMGRRRRLVSVMSCIKPGLARCIGEF